MDKSLKKPVTANVDILNTLVKLINLNKIQQKCKRKYILSTQRMNERFL